MSPNRIVNYKANPLKMRLYYSLLTTQQTANQTLTTTIHNTYATPIRCGSNVRDKNKFAVLQAARDLVSRAACLFIYNLNKQSLKPNKSL